MFRSLLTRRLGGGRLGAALALVAALVTTAAPPAAGISSHPAALAASTADGSTPVVLIGTGGVRWDDVDGSTPVLAAMLGQGSSAALAVRSVRDTTCPADGWLAVSAGRRAADAEQPDRSCRTLSAQLTAQGGSGRAENWESYRAEAEAGRFDAVPGLLGSTLAAAGISRAAVGPGAIIATADRSGSTPKAWPGVPAAADGTLDPTADAVGLADQVRSAVASGATFIAVDLGAVRDTTARKSASNGPFTRQEQVSGLDTRLGLVTGALPAGATVIIASLADSGAPGHLQVVLAYGPRTPGGPGGTFGPGLLRAASTRQDGLVQSTDLLPAVLTALGVPVPTDAVGSPLTQVDGGDSLDRQQRVLDLDQAAIEVERAVTPFFVVYGVTELLVLAGLGLAAHRARVRPIVRRRALVGLRVAAVVFSLVPVATFLANLWPWWRTSPVGLPLTLGVVTATVALAIPTFAGPWRRSLLGPAGVAGALTAVVLTIDLALGSPLQLAALIGGQPIIAGRFYGLSNPTFALFATGSLLGALALAELMLARGRSPRQAAAVVAAVGVLATLVDGAPTLGSDFGGPPALVPAFGLLALWVAGFRVTWSRLLAIGTATVGALVLLSVADWLRPADRRSHLGRFVQSVLDGEGGLIVARKAEQNLGILVSTPLTLTIPVATVAIVAVLWRPERWYAPALALAYGRQPLLRVGLAALGVMLLIGFVANDSGTAVPPASLMLFAPLLIAVCARTVELDDAERLERALREARQPTKKR